MICTKLFAEAMTKIAPPLLARFQYGINEERMHGLKLKPQNTIIGLSFIVFALIGCQNQTATTGTVHFRGAMKNVMQKGDISAQIDLDSLAGKPHLFALGAIEDLKGEIQVFDGESFISVVVDSAVAIQQTFSERATLLVYSQVPQWQEIAVPAEVRTELQLQEFIAERISRDNITTKPFAFLLKGGIAKLSWHVIDWPEGDDVHTHEKHKQSGANGILENEFVDIVGFYSESHHGIFTHHSSNVHMHFKTRRGQLAGHVDRVDLKEGMTLFLPKT